MRQVLRMKKPIKRVNSYREFDINLYIIFPCCKKSPKGVCVQYSVDHKLQPVTHYIKCETCGRMGLESKELIDAVNLWNRANVGRDAYFSAAARFAGTG